MKTVIKSIIILIVISTFSIGSDRFSRDDDKNIVIDRKTGLQWQDNDGTKVIKRNWRDAITHCENLELDGNNWRLPNIRELNSIVDETRSNPAIYNAFKNIENRKYWSSTSTVEFNNFDNAWFVHFSDGDSRWRFKDTDAHPGALIRDKDYFVRCVRSK